MSLPSLENWFKIFGIEFFQTLIHFFCYLLIFVKKVLKANIFAFDKTILLIPSLTLTNMSNMFFAFFAPFFFSFFKTKFFRDSWGVNTALSKILRIFCKKLRRNKQKWYYMPNYLQNFMVLVLNSTIPGMKKPEQYKKQHNNLNFWNPNFDIAEKN